MPTSKVKQSRSDVPQHRRRLGFETLEPRVLLAGDTYLVNFQLASAPVPTRYMVDSGQVFGIRPNGLSYGWSADHTDQARDRGLAADQRLDTLIHIEAGQFWEFQLANGNYEVTVSVGDPANNDGLHTINVEGVNFWNAMPDPDGALTMTKQVTVADGRLTMNQGAAADKATRVNYVHIVGLPGGPNSAPAVPTITEPAVDALPLNPSDVHMEAVAFTDTDGNLHKSTDWEIWTVGANPEPVWQTLGIGGVERLHTHLGDGVFINSHAGGGLLPDVDYQLRVRFRDDAGSVSNYATRGFHTAPDSTPLPLELSDIASSGVTWQSIAGPVILPSAAPDQPRLRIEAADGDLLLSIAGNNGITNTVSNPAPLGDHVFVRVVVQAGSAALNLPETDLTFLDDHGQQHTIYLPAVNLAAGQRLDLWVSSSGATYYGSAAQTEPEFTNLARDFDALVPFLAMKPGFVVEEVAGGFQLPVNIAFVPNPGPDPDDPLFYVNELYGTIKMVTRDYTVSTYATGLLNFNPTGSFPGSGEQGLAGIVVDPLSGDLFVTRVRSSSSNPDDDSAPHYPQVVRLSSNDGGRTASSVTVIRDMPGETMGQSHQISNITIGPDGMLYVHVGDGFVTATAQNLNSYRGKILRMTLTGAAPTDNPFYNAGNGINSADYVYAYGVRNPFGGAWRISDAKHYEVENGPSIDRMAQINRGVNYGWNGSDASMTNLAIYNWNPAHAPVNIDFIQSSTFAGSQFPAGMLDHAFVSESGPTYAVGPQSRGKRISEFTINSSGVVTSGPTTLVEYAGFGYGTVAALSAGPDGLYFSELYKDLDPVSPIDAGARIFRVRYVNPLLGDFDIDGDVDAQDNNRFRSTYGSNLLLAADANNNKIVDAADYVVWRKFAGGAGGQSAGAGSASAEQLSSATTLSCVAAAQPSSTSSNPESSGSSESAELIARADLIEPAGKFFTRSSLRTSPSTSFRPTNHRAILLALSTALEANRTIDSADLELDLAAEDLNLPAIDEALTDFWPPATAAVSPGKGESQ